jgi:hypothetical protein
VIPQLDPDETVVAETLVTIGAFDDRRITVLQPLQRVRRRARYEFLVENHGNNLANCRLHLVDPAGRVDGQFDPPAVGVAPGASSLVQLRARATRGGFRPGDRQLDFEIEATEPDHGAARGRATLVQTPTIPVRALARLAAIAAVVGAAALAWFGVVRPELRQAADRAVDDRIAELTEAGQLPNGTVAPVPVTTPPPGTGAPASTVPSQIVVGPAPVTYADYRIDVDAAIDQERRGSTVVPPGVEFQLTDVVLQNPHGDLGLATLLRDDEVLYEWDLGQMNSANEFQPRISPLSFQPGENLVLLVDCEASGRTDGAGCEISVLLTGSLIPLDP